MTFHFYGYMYVPFSLEQESTGLQRLTGKWYVGVALWKAVAVT